MTTNCKSCIYWDIDKARATNGRVISNLGAPCLYPIERVILAIPASFRYFREIKQISEMKLMVAAYGETCPVWEKRT